MSGELADLGLLAADTPVAGASAGSLIAACTKSGLSYSTLLDATLQLSRDCRTKGTRFRLRRVLQSFLQDLLPDDIHHRATGTVHVSPLHAASCS